MDLRELAQRRFHRAFESLTAREQKVVERVAQRRHISRNVQREVQEQLTLGQRLADRVAAFGGSWTFILLFAGLLFLWVLLNSLVLLHWKEAFDPYPYILLNLVLSMLAALQAPIIMMSQNRQAAKDRAEAEHDYEVNLKAELEILALHEKVDALLDRQWKELMTMQQEQMQVLRELVGAREPSASGKGG